MLNLLLKEGPQLWLLTWFQGMIIAYCDGQLYGQLQNISSTNHMSNSL